MPFFLKTVLEHVTEEYYRSAKRWYPKEMLDELVKQVEKQNNDSLVKLEQ